MWNIFKWLFALAVLLQVFGVFDENAPNESLSKKSDQIANSTKAEKAIDSSNPFGSTNLTQAKKKAEKSNTQVAKVTPLAIKKATSVNIPLFVTGSIVNARSGPGTTFPVLAKLKYGTKVHKVLSEGEWVKIELSSSSFNLWMHGNYLSKRKPEIIAPAKKTTVKKRSVRPPTTREVTLATKEIISQSIRSYPGSCPCPYNRDRGGRRCGGRSAWSRPGGYSPMCYESDVTKSRLKTYFARIKGVTY